MDQQLIDEALNELNTIHDFIRWSVSRFHEADVYFGHGTDNAWDEAVSLIAWSLFLPVELPHDIKSARLTQSEKLRVIETISRRINEKIPAAYITNQAWFAGQPYYVDERVLVPRSPIAELIETKFEQVVGDKPVNRILDMCTGSGCIAIACAYAFEDADIDAADISFDALEVADINIHEHHMAEQVFPVQSDLFSNLTGQRYDLIVSNPPYVDADDLEDMPHEFSHEPEIGLGSGPDGLELTRRILACGARFLNDDGVLVVEVGNSFVHLQEQFPQVNFQWLTFERGGHGVFAITKSELIKHQELFEERAGFGG